MIQDRSIPTTPERSALMSKIRSFGNKSTEMAMAALIRSHGFNGWRRHQPLPGKPDFAFRKEKVTIFVDGCFWHGCPRCYKTPNSNAEFWSAKILATIRRDKKVARELRKKGWRVIRVWEHSLKEPDKVANRIARYLNR